MGFARRPGLLMLCALPDVGVLGTPLYLIRHRPELGTFTVRMFAQKLALSVPAFGQRGGLLEMVAVAAVQTLVVRPARILPWAVVVATFALLLELWSVALLALSLYAGAVAWGLVRQPGGRGSTAAAYTGWRIGLP